MEQFAHQGVEHATTLEAATHTLVSPLILGIGGVIGVTVILLYRYFRLKQVRIPITKKEQ